MLVCLIVGSQSGCKFYKFNNIIVINIIFSDAETEDTEKFDEQPTVGKSKDLESGDNKTAEEKIDEVTRGSKRRASVAFSDADEDFKGFDQMDNDDLCKDYNKVLGKQAYTFIISNKQLGKEINLVINT